MSSLEALVTKKGLSLAIEIFPAAEGSVRIDKEKIVTITQTLLENAIAYTPKGGSIKVAAEEKGGSFLLHVTDTGIGIAEKDRPRVFSQFFRGEKARRFKPIGFGIGLFLVKIFLKAHNGEIWFTSREGKGTTFSFRLPIIQAPTEKLLEEIT